MLTAQNKSPWLLVWDKVDLVLCTWYEAKFIQGNQYFTASALSLELYYTPRLPIMITVKLENVGKYTLKSWWVVKHLWLYVPGRVSVLFLLTGNVWGKTGILDHMSEGCWEMGGSWQWCLWLTDRTSCSMAKPGDSPSDCF